MARVEALLSWNMCSGPQVKPDRATKVRRLAHLATMLRDHAPSLIALQEAPSAANVRTALGVSFDVESTPNGVVSAYDTRLWNCDEREATDPRILVLGLRAVGAGTNLWMINVHGPALYVEVADRQDFIRAVARRLEALRRSDPDRREILVGDLNLPPFDQAIMREKDLHASRSLPWVMSRASGLNRALFNPTWRILGRHDGASGTLYKSGISFDGPWRAFDQVMVSAELANGLALDVVENIGGVALRKSGRVGAPNAATGSDHLPLLAKVSVP